MAVFKDDDGEPVDAKDAGKVILRSGKGIAKGAAKVLTGDLDGAREEYHKTKKDNDEILDSAKSKKRGSVLHDHPRSKKDD
jgi:hypothetical protein